MNLFAYLQDLPEHLSGKFVEVMASHLKCISNEFNDWSVV